MPTFVHDWCKHGCPPPAGHSCDAQLVLIGEAPGRYEDETGQPFVGPAGRTLEQWWEPLGLHRADFYITNVYPYRPPANKIEAIPHEQIEFWSSRLHERLATLADPVVVVPTGNTALRALFGEKRNISDWRGSICGYNAHGRVIKTIPTFHPAATFRQPILAKFCVADWKRIAGDCAFRGLAIPQRTTVAEPTGEEFSHFLDGLEHLQPQVIDGIVIPPAMAIDVETDRSTKELLCVGFSFDPAFALVCPTTPRALTSPDTLARMMDYVRRLCAHPIPKVGQNFQFDKFMLNRNNITVINDEWDLIEMDHALDPNDGGDVTAGTEGSPDDGGIRMSMHALDVLASLRTRQPQWKHLGRTGKGEGINWLQLFDYNAIDDCVTIEMYPGFYADLVRAGML